MKVTTETLPERQIKLQIEIDDERHAQAMEQAYKRLAPQVRIRGFRPGKAPRQLIEKEIGHHRLLDEAMDLVVPEAYREAIEQESIVPVAQPSVELVSHEPLVFTATIPLQPSIEFEDYTTIRVPREKTLATDEQVEESIEELRRRYGTMEPVERPAAKGDILRGSVKAVSEGVNLINQEEIEFRLSDETLASLPGLADLLVGLKKGETLETTASVPEDYADERLKGKPIDYLVKIEEVKEEKLAEANDELAKQVGEGFESLEALRERIREDVQKQLDDTDLKAYESLCLDALVQKATIEFPTVMIDHEVEHLLEEQANLDPRDPRAVEFYIQRLNKSEDEVKESVRPDAEERLRRSLVLSRFADNEGIAVEEPDIEAEIETMVGQAGEQGEMIRTIFNGQQGRENLERSILTRKTFTRLVEIASGGSEAGESQAAGAQASAETAGSEAEEGKKPARKPKARRSAPRETE